MSSSAFPSRYPPGSNRGRPRHGEEAWARNQPKGASSGAQGRPGAGKWHRKKAGARMRSGLGIGYGPRGLGEMIREITRIHFFKKKGLR